jgi:bacteriocin biosynthesis cyclodehydratase domain-containing protein
MTSHSQPAAASAAAGAAAPIPLRPRLKPWFRVATDPSAQELVLRYGDAFTVFRGAAAVCLLPPLMALLDGSHDVEEIHVALGEAVRPATEQALAQLAQHGTLMEGTDVGEPANHPGGSVARDLSARVDGMVTPAECAARLASARIPVLGEGLLAAECVRQLRLAGCAGATPCDTSDWDADASTTVVALEGADDPLPTWMNARALEHGARWIMAVPFDGVSAIAGPMFIPGHTACHTCLRLRRAANADDPARQRAWDATVSERATSSSSAMAAIVAALVVAPVTEGLALRALAGEPMAGIAKTVELGFYGPDIATHHVYRVPRCPACSRVRDQGDPVPWHQPSPNEAAS